MYLLPGLKDKKNYGTRKLYVFCGFWFLIAFLEFIQDYISSTLNGGEFQLFESLAYKLFWLLFIPSTFLLIASLNKFNLRSKLRYVGYFLQIISISFFHLIIFSLVLFSISKLIHDGHSWQLHWLITEKFSNRLYIALSIYLVITVVFFWLKQREAKSPEQDYSKTLVVKNGRKSVIVNVDSIKWISSNGPYLYLHTTSKRHIVSDSLKNIIRTLPENFKRIHRSTIVNTGMVKELKSRMNGDYDVIMNDTHILRLSRNYRKSLKGTLL